MRRSSSSRDAAADTKQAETKSSSNTEGEQLYMKLKGEALGYKKGPHKTIKYQTILVWLGWGIELDEKTKAKLLPVTKDVIVCAINAVVDELVVQTKTLEPCENDLVDWVFRKNQPLISRGSNSRHMYVTPGQQGHLFVDGCKKIAEKLLGPDWESSSSVEPAKYALVIKNMGHLNARMKNKVYKSLVHESYLNAARATEGAPVKPKTLVMRLVLALLNSCNRQGKLDALGNEDVISLLRQCHDDDRYTETKEFDHLAHILLESEQVDVGASAPDAAVLEDDDASTHQNQGNIMMAAIKIYGIDRGHAIFNNAGVLLDGDHATRLFEAAREGLERGILSSWVTKHHASYQLQCKEKIKKWLVREVKNSDKAIVMDCYEPKGSPGLIELLTQHYFDWAATTSTASQEELLALIKALPAWYALAEWHNGATSGMNTNYVKATIDFINIERSSSCQAEFNATIKYLKAWVVVFMLNTISQVCSVEMADAEMADAERAKQKIIALANRCFSKSPVWLEYKGRPQDMPVQRALPSSACVNVFNAAASAASMLTGARQSGQYLAPQVMQAALDACIKLESLLVNVRQQQAAQATAGATAPRRTFFTSGAQCLPSSTVGREPQRVVMSNTTAACSAQQPGPRPGYQVPPSAGARRPGARLKMPLKRNRSDLMKPEPRILKSMKPEPKDTASSPKSPRR